MSTKTIISVFVLALLFATNHSMGATKKHTFSFENRVSENIPSGSNQQNDRPLGNGNDWIYDVPKTNNESGHDHETHHFNYDRFYKNRNRILFIIAIKLLLFIAHISTLLLSTMHFLE